MANNIRMSGLISGLDTDLVVQQMTSKYTEQKNKLLKEKQLLTYKQDNWQDINKDVYSLFTDLSKLRFSSNYQTKEVSSSDDKIAKVSGDRVSGIHDLNVKQIATQTYLTGSVVKKSEPIDVSGTLTIIAGGQEQDINITPDMSMADVAKKLSAAGVSANFDKQNARLFIASKNSGSNSDFDIRGNDELLSALGLGSASIKKVGQDSVIELNGAEFTSSSTNFKINGMSIDVYNKGSVSIGGKVTNNIFNNIKSFIEKYNDLIKKIDSSYNDNSSKGLQPLLKEEKESLSDREIEEWEDKVKKGALSKDSSLYSLSNLLKNTMSSTSFNGMTLSSLGITLGNYFQTSKGERGVYKIDENKLKNAIEEDPSKVMNFMTKLSASLYDKLNNKMRSTSLNSVYSVFNDKQMKESLNSYEKKIKDFENKIAKKEDQLYAQFSKMEASLSRIQSQGSYLNSFFGIGQ